MNLENPEPKLRNVTLPVMIIDDEPDFLNSLQITLRSAGLRNIFLCRNAEDAISQINEIKPGVVLLDLNMPGKGGVEILRELNASCPELVILIISGESDIATAVNCIKNGAFDFIEKPVNRSQLLAAVRRSLDVAELRVENSRMKTGLLSTHQNSDTLAFSTIITTAPAMRALFTYCTAIARSAEAVLIRGETGTGKELFARAIHDASKRKGAFIAVNLAGVDAHFFADTLFGHAKGSFTGADKQRPGLVEQATDGTLFLDEIGDLDTASQVKLLRLLQEKEFYPLGSDTPKSTNARIIAATHRNLYEDTASGRFRSDCYFRLRTHEFEIPPLRDRLDDLPLLLKYFISQSAHNLGIIPPDCSPELLAALRHHPFPGNIRELRAMVCDAVSRCQGSTIGIQDFKLPFDTAILRRITAETSQTSQTSINDPLLSRFPHTLPTIKEHVDALVEEALRRTNHHQRSAAAILGISQQALSKRLKTKK